MNVIPILLAQTQANLVKEWSFTGNQVLFYFVAIAFFVALNGFFVATEFALVKVRDSQLAEAEKAKRSGATMARHQLTQLDAYLSAAQLGITLASLALGMLGEPVIAVMLQPLFYKLGMTSEATLHTVSVGIAYAIMSFLHVVVGEQLPKTFAIRKALETSLKVAPAMHVCYMLLRPATYVLNSSAGLLLKMLGVKPSSEHGLGHSEDELRQVLSQSDEGVLTGTERNILLNTLALNDRTVRDVMTPRNLVVYLDVEDDPETNLKKAISHQHTRYPVVEGHLDNTIGVIHVKDLLKASGENLKDILRYKRNIIEVPELIEVDRLLNLFLKRKEHLALVVDEYGGAVGIVTLDNVLERIVGDIQDEFDDEHPMFRRVDENEFVVQGLFNIDDLQDRVGIQLEPVDVSTVGGYISHLLGRLPKQGDSVMMGDYEAWVETADDRRVISVRFNRRKSDSADT
jgi:CBS domain containing-hemolysin-like protein